MALKSFDDVSFGELDIVYTEHAKDYFTPGGLQEKSDVQHFSTFRVLSVPSLIATK